jgi:N-acetylated-alpha-linked acidic dipeptidase
LSDLRLWVHSIRAFLLIIFLLLVAVTQQRQRVSAQANRASAIAANPVNGFAVPDHIFGYRDFAQQAQVDQRFIASPDPKLAEGHLRTLTAEPHMAGTLEDRKTAEYVAQKFRAAGLETQIVEYKVLLPRPLEVSINVTAPATVHMHGPTRERVDRDPYQDDWRVVMPFNGYSPSGDVEAELVYANYGRPEDFKRLEEMNVDFRGKIVVVRYGANYRGVKSYVAQEHGAAGVIIYSDPMDDGYFRGDKYPRGPFRPDSGVQRGSVSYTFKYPGDPSTPGVASTLTLPESKRINAQQAPTLPKIPTTPISYTDARPLLENLGGPESPRDWQGALPFTYHVGPGPVRVKMHLKMEIGYRSIWDVIGIARGSQLPDEWVIAGNHRDAWVYGAADPNSGTAAMLETVHGIGDLLKSGWRPKRTIVFGSWDGEEQGMLGSTEWGEEHERELANAAAYFNVDVAVSGPNFGASAVPALKQFVRDATKMVPSPKGGTVYEVWKEAKAKDVTNRTPAELAGSQNRPPNARVDQDVEVGDLGSGSDYSVFLQRMGVPATDIGSGGPYGVYHSVFDNFAWFKKFADPDFKYEQEMARVLGIQVLHMADADFLPVDYSLYGKEIVSYVQTAQSKAQRAFGAGAPSFDSVLQAARRFAVAGNGILPAQNSPNSDLTRLNRVLRDAERGLLIPQGLPNRAWYRHAIYAPGEYTGYAAVVIPGVNEAIDANDSARVTSQLAILAEALNRAANVLESYGEFPK